MEETQCRVPRDGWHLYLIDNNDVESHDRLCRLAINLKTWLYTVASHYTVRTNEYLVRVHICRTFIISFHKPSNTRTWHPPFKPKTSPSATNVTSTLLIGGLVWNL